MAFRYGMNNIPYSTSNFINRSAAARPITTPPHPFYQPPSPHNTPRSRPHHPRTDPPRPRSHPNSPPYAPLPFHSLFWDVFTRKPFAYLPIQGLKESR